jgi:acyl carrier protein
MDQIFPDRLTRTFRLVFDNPNLQVNRSTSAKDVEGWDSLTYINLIVAIEREFSIRFTTAEIARLKNVGELADLIAGKLS